MELVNANGVRCTVTSVKVQTVEKMESSFNFEVSQTHTYFAGNSYILVHNACGGGGNSNAKFEYDSNSQRYRNTENGKFVSQKDLPYPSNGGFANRTEGNLEKGTIVDRYGSTKGSYAGTPGDTVSQRGLPPGSEALEYNKFEVMKPIAASVGTAAPVKEFNAEGGATQYKFTDSRGNFKSLN